jgi:hypothetical protein
MPGALAFQTDPVVLLPRHHAGEQRGDHLEHLTAVDGAAPQFQIDLDMCAHRAHRLQGLDVGGRGIHGCEPLAPGCEIAQRL